MYFLIYWIRNRSRIRIWTRNENFGFGFGFSKKGPDPLGFGFGFATLVPTIIIFNFWSIFSWDSVGGGWCHKRWLDGCGRQLLLLAHSWVRKSGNFPASLAWHILCFLNCTRQNSKKDWGLKACLKMLGQWGSHDIIRIVLTLIRQALLANPLRTGS
jgi:hypothetical protein